MVGQKFHSKDSLAIIYPVSCVSPVSFFHSNLSFMTALNAFVRKNVKQLELTGVLMRIVSFTLVSWLGPKSPFLFVWIFNTIDAALLSYCAILRKDSAYSLLNVFWIIVGIVGIARASGMM